jgi:O-antigen/teichoic acid export membrane protein
MTLLLSIQRRFLGRVATLAIAIALSAGLSLALLQLTTRVLHAADYGAYALLMALVGLVSAAMDGGAALLVPMHYRTASASERGRIFVSVAGLGAAGAVAGGLLLCSLWILQNGALSDHSIPVITIALAAALMPMRVVTNNAVMVLSATGRSSAIAAQMICQACVVFVGTLGALFGFGMAGESLLIGATCGQFVAMCACLLVLGFHGELSLPSGRWFRHAMTSAPTTGAAGFIEGSRGLGEGAMLSALSGLHATGILSHARLYFNLLMTLTSAVSHNIWARTLEDARNPHSDFETTRSAWTPVQIIISCTAIVFVFLGKNIVDVVSNGKLTEAASYVPLLFIMALIQVTEQPTMAIVSTSDRASSATWFRTLLMLIFFIILYPTIALFGINAIVVVCIIEAVAYRIFMRIVASRIRLVPFQDEVAVFGGFAVISALAYQHLVTPPLGIQLTLIVVGIAMVIVVGRRSVGEMISATRQILRTAGLSRHRAIGAPAP